jgi:hypothetical protein
MNIVCHDCEENKMKKERKKEEGKSSNNHLHDID